MRTGIGATAPRGYPPPLALGGHRPHLKPYATATNRQACARPMPMQTANLLPNVTYTSV